MNDATPDTKTTIALQPRTRAQLSQLSKAIEHEVQIVEARMKSSLKHALKAGQLLCQAKKLVVHGQWLDWFETSDFSFSESSAQRYMRLYRRWDEVQKRLGEEGEAAHLSDLTFSQALTVLTRPKPKPRLISTMPLEETPLLPAIGSEADGDGEHGPTETPRIHSNGENGHHAAISHRDEWLTPGFVVAAAVRVLSEIDLDPASDGLNVPAARHYTKAEDGLNPSLPWSGRLFLNPPLEPLAADAFVDRLLHEYGSGQVIEAIVLAPAMTDVDWFRRLSGFVRAFLARHDSAQDENVPGPLVAIYVGARHDAFCSEFVKLGDVFVPYLEDNRGSVSSGSSIGRVITNM